MRARICFMICSTSTESERMLNSAIDDPSGRFVPAAAGELRRLLDAGAEDADRLAQRAQPTVCHGRGRGPDIGEAIGGCRDSTPVLEQTSPRTVEYLLHAAFSVRRIPETVVIDDAGDVGPRRQHGFERPLNGFAQRAPVNQVL